MLEELDVSNEDEDSLDYVLAPGVDLQGDTCKIFNTTLQVHRLPFLSRSCLQSGKDIYSRNLCAIYAGLPVVACIWMPMLEQISLLLKMKLIS